MSLHETIVSYQSISRALGGNMESVVRVAQEDAAESGEPGAPSRAEMLAQLTHAMQELEGEQFPPDVMVSAQDQVASLLQTLVAREAAKAGQVEPLASGGLEAKFDSKDVLGWAKSLFTWWRKIRPHPFVAPSDTIGALPSSARIALLSDWGTGLYGAPVCAKSIANDAAGYQIVMHLGDVYYSGDDDEVRDRFLKFWPRVAGATSLALNGNHEMYTGGKAYFELILKDLGQPSSCFAVQNDHWTLVGLDTAYDDHDLTHGQAEWLERIVADGGDRRTILFSHHQPYSLLDKQGPKLVKRLGRLLDDGKIFAWYWGHEHRCLLYDVHPLWNMHGRCIGHSGFPYFRDKLGDAPKSPAWHRIGGRNLVPGGLLLLGPNIHIPGHESEYGPHGYLTLEFQDQHLIELVQDADGTLLKETELA
jgi:hypothetical protein